MKDHFLPPPCQKRACDCLHSSTEPQTTTPPPLSEPQQPDPVCMTVTGVSGQPHRLVAVSVNAAPSIKPPLETSTHARAHTRTQSLTADDCPWFLCVSEAENLAQRHAPFHLRAAVFDGFEFRRDSRRRSVHMRRQPGSRKHSAPLRWHSPQTRCCSARLLCPAACSFYRLKTRRKLAYAESNRLAPDSLAAVLSSLGVCVFERRTSENTCYFPIAD